MKVTKSTTTPDVSSSRHALSAMLGAGFGPAPLCREGILRPSCTSSEEAANTAVRYCPRCKENKPFEEFGRRTRAGRKYCLPYCRPCHLAYHREWRKKRGHEVYAGYYRDARSRYPEKIYARKVVAAALFCGMIKRGECAIGGACSGKVEAHHDDYLKPLEIVWVCRHHHRPLDRARRAKDRAA